MLEIPDTHYARNGSVNLAYQVVGDGPLDVLYLTPGISHLDYLWQYPPFVDFVGRFASYSRVALFDCRGCGLSDRQVDPPSVAEATADAIAVLDTVGMDRAHLFGVGQGAATALALAAAHPDRVTKVAVHGAICCAVATEDFPWGADPVEGDAIATIFESAWGGPDLFAAVAPTRADDHAMARWFSGMNRAGVSPAGAAAWYRKVLEIDIRPILDDVVAPVLVTNRMGAAVVDPGQSRYLADHLPDVRHLEFPGEDYMLWGMADTDAILDEVEEFFTGTRPTHAPTRALATVVFTDIVGSTDKATELGDAAWRDLLTRHDDLTRRRVEAHHGRVVKSTGDGALATFDDPDQAITSAQALSAELAGAGLDIRVGIHSGQIEITGDDVAGIAVHLASRISGLAGPGDIYVSSTVRDLLLGSTTQFDDRGTHDLKGIPGTWEVLAVVNI